MAKRNIFKNRGKTYIFSNKGGGGESGITVTPLTVTENGTYTSAAGQAYSPVTVRVEGDVEVEDNKPVSISENGTVVINPTSGKDAMAKVTATVNVPSEGVNTLFAWVSSGYYVYTTTANPTTQDEAYVLDSEGTNIYTEEITEVGEGTITIEKYGTSTYEYERAPDADITLQAGEGGSGTLYCWEGDYGESLGTVYLYSYSANPEVGDYLIVSQGESGAPAQVNTDWWTVNSISDTAGRVEITVKDGDYVYTGYDGEPVVFVRYPAGDILSADIEENKAATIDVSQYSAPVEITPTSGKAGMAKATVTLSNIPTESDIETEKTVSITQNGTYIINPTTGKDAMAKVTATVNVATATVEGTNLILSSGSVSGNTLNL